MLCLENTFLYYFYAGGGVICATRFYVEEMYIQLEQYYIYLQVFVPNMKLYSKFSHVYFLMINFLFQTFSSYLVNINFNQYLVILTGKNKIKLGHVV